MNREEYEIRYDAKGIEVTIRPIQEDELEILRRLFKKIIEKDIYSLDTLVENHTKYPSLFIGAFAEDEMVGFVFGWPEGTLVAHGLAVLERLRRRGIGMALLRSFENAALKAGFKRYALGARWEAIPFYLSFGLDCFANVQITPEKFPWDTVSSLRSDYEISGASVFGSAMLSQLISRLNRELGVEAQFIKGDVDSISIRIRPKEISKEALRVLKRDFNSYSTQYSFYRSMRTRTCARDRTSPSI